MKILKIVSILVLCQIVTTTSLMAAMTDLTALTQGKGNKGPSWVPFDSLGNPVTFTLTARSYIDSSLPFSVDASGEIGTIFVEKDDKGTGVQDRDADGSKGISGAGKDQNEELIFTYDNPVSLDSIFLELNDIDFGDSLNDKDDPVLFISQAGSGLFDTITEDDIFAYSAFTFTDKKRGILDLGSFSSSLGYSAIDAFTIRETHDHIFVTGVSEATPSVVPAPSALLLSAVGTMCAGYFRRRLAV